MSLVDFAKAELALALPAGEEGLYGDALPGAVMELIEVFARQGHSGGSAPIVASLFSRLANYEPLGPITGQPDEWVKVTDEVALQRPLWQNRRCSAVFKEGLDQKAYFVDAIIWENQHGNGYSGTAFLPDGSRINSRQYVRSFPFTPKSFTVRVEEEETEPDNWKFTVADELALADALTYYERYHL